MEDENAHELATVTDGIDALAEGFEIRLDEEWIWDEEGASLYWEAVKTVSRLIMSAAAVQEKAS